MKNILKILLIFFLLSATASAATFTGYYNLSQTLSSGQSLTLPDGAERVDVSVSGEVPEYRAIVEENASTYPATPIIVMPMNTPNNLVTGIAATLTGSYIDNGTLCTNNTGTSYATIATVNTAPYNTVHYHIEHNISEYAGADRLILHGGYAVGGIDVQLNSGQVRIYFGTATGFNAGYSFVTFTPSTWQTLDIVVRKSANEADIYVDGAFVKTHTIGTWVDTNTALRIGSATSDQSASMCTDKFIMLGNSSAENVAALHYGFSGIQLSGQPYTRGTQQLNLTGNEIEYVATDGIAREVTVRAEYADNVTVLDETNDGYYYSVNLSHQAGSTVTSGTIIYDTGRPSLTGMEFSSTNPSATYTTEGSLLIISTGALTSGDTYTYSFALPTYSVSGHIICDENSTPIIGADVVLNGFSATTNETGYFVFPSVTNGTYTITASKYGYYAGDQTITISGDDIGNVNITMCQVEPATANETYLPWQIYGIFFAFSTLLVFYAFLHRDFENYTHVLSSFASGALNILLGYSTYIGIVFLNPTTYYYKSEIYAGFHIIWGGVMILLTVIYIIDIGKRTFIEKQVREEYELTGRR